MFLCLLLQVLQCHLVCSETLVARGRLVGLSTYGDVLACYTDRGLLSLYSLRTRTEDSRPSESKEVKAQRKKLAYVLYVSTRPIFIRF